MRAVEWLEENSNWSSTWCLQWWSSTKSSIHPDHPKAMANSIYSAEKAMGESDSIEIAFRRDPPRLQGYARSSPQKPDNKPPWPASSRVTPGGTIRVPHEVKSQRWRKGLCIKCGRRFHKKINCRTGWAWDWTLSEISRIERISISTAQTPSPLL